jgi:hypothetical protein
MPEAERDSTQDWLLPAAARPATMHELEQRVDVALAVARSAEAAAVEIGAAAFDAAKQAQRAAESAERAVGGKVVPLVPTVGSVAEPAVVEPEAVGDEAQSPRAPGEAAGHDERLRLFSERADRVMIRLRALEPVA